jgi:hypothetical protein
MRLRTVLWVSGRDNEGLEGAMDVEPVSASWGSVDDRLLPAGSRCHM